MTVSSVIEKVHIRLAFTLELLTMIENPPELALDVRTPSVFVQLSGKRSNDSTHSDRLGQLYLQVTSQCNGSFFFVVVKTNVYKNASLCAISTCRSVFKSKSQI